MCARCQETHHLLRDLIATGLSGGAPPIASTPPPALQAAPSRQGRLHQLWRNREWRQRGDGWRRGGAGPVQWQLADSPAHILIIVILLLIVILVVVVNAVAVVRARHGDGLRLRHFHVCGDEGIEDFGRHLRLPGPLLQCLQEAVGCREERECRMPPRGR